MNFTVIREHREFFRNHHWIECDSLLSAGDQKRLIKEIPQVLIQRTEVKSSVSTKAFDKDLFGVGYDLWRGDPWLKKTLLNHALAGIAGELIEQKPLRFGYDTFFPAVAGKLEKNEYSIFLQSNPTLEEMSCIQGVLCGAMLCLSGNSDTIDQTLKTTIFSTTPGNAVFFSTGWPLPLDEIYQNPGFTYLLIVYAKANAVYMAQKGAPHLHHFKRLGYNFGDRLKEPFHPIVYS